MSATYRLLWASVWPKPDPDATSGALARNATALPSALSSGTGSPVPPAQVPGVGAMAGLNVAKGPWHGSAADGGLCDTTVSPLAAQAGVGGAGGAGPPGVGGGG